MNLHKKEDYIAKINDLWEHRNEININDERLPDILDILKGVMTMLDQGIWRSCDNTEQGWLVNAWIKKAIMLFFKLGNNILSGDKGLKWFDKIPAKFSQWSGDQFNTQQVRAVPGSYVRYGAYVGKNVVLMPCFINIGAYIDDKTMIDTWATIGSCAQIGKYCHISGGVGIGGVLEPVQSRPVIIEDHCFIGARSQIAEGVIIGQGSVIGMGTYIGGGIKVIDRETGNEVLEENGRKIPPYSVVVPGSMPGNDPRKPSVNCAVIIKRVDESIRAKTAINELLRS